MADIVNLFNIIFDRPGVAGAGTHTYIINSMIDQSSFGKISSKQLHSQTVGARELKF